MSQKKYAVIIFDGLCNLCNNKINFVIRNDKKDYFRFAPLQSEIGKKQLAKHHIHQHNFNTFFLLENNKTYKQSTAVLRIIKKLDGLWPILYVLIIIPAFMRNVIYNIIAKNRYKWWGKRDSCAVPDGANLEKFL